MFGHLLLNQCDDELITLLILPYFCIIFNLSYEDDKVKHTFLFLWRSRRMWAQAASFSKFLDHTRLDKKPVELLRARDQLIPEVVTYTTHNIHKTQKSMSSAGFQPTIPGIKWL